MRPERSQVLVEMSPSAKTIKRGVDLFNLDNIIRTADALKGGSHIFVKQDEGNKKEKKLLYVSAATFFEGVVVEETLGAVAGRFRGADQAGLRGHA